MTYCEHAILYSYSYNTIKHPVSNKTVAKIFSFIQYRQLYRIGNLENLKLRQYSKLIF